MAIYCWSKKKTRRTSRRFRSLEIRRNCASFSSINLHNRLLRFSKWIFSTLIRYEKKPPVILWIQRSMKVRGTNFDHVYSQLRVKRKKIITRDHYSLYVNFLHWVDFRYVITAVSYVNSSNKLLHTSSILLRLNKCSI